MNFENIFEKYKNDIYRLAYSYTLNFSDTDDIVQNVFLKLYKTIRKSKMNDEHIKRWLIVVTNNECKNLLLSTWKKKTCKLEENIINYKSNDNYKFDIIDYLRKLPEKYRIPIYLYYYEGYNIKEISQILNINESTLKSQIHRAKQKLKLEMEEK